LGLNHKHDAFAQIIRSRTRLAEKGVALAGRDLERGQEELTQLVGFGGHGEPRAFNIQCGNGRRSVRKKMQVNRLLRAAGP
jgi:hypothetical protein